ncbi:thiolase family protein [Bacillus sp. KH172YL63]|uniref:thiolase family protein n=1 Tax=Bacillus sp. KH172YL63 TaxID=2709784 RepID=UPI0013E4B075|nr:thiolase family protein [Bacillus sp. KH172YL63]BCB02896.1 acetyl-CoA acetyltransferase [Bacillus sp. KH172YL63]
MKEAVIVWAKRTPVGKCGGSLKDVPPQHLAAPLIRALVTETGIVPEEIDDVILGNTVGPGGNLARLSALTAGLPVKVPGVTVDRQCGSGLEAIVTACRLVQSGAGEVYVAGGVESTSLAPWKMDKPAHPVKAPRIFTRARFSPDHIGDPEMGEAAENVAEAFRISRRDQDEYALKSHQKAVRAQKEKRFTGEIVPVEHVMADECPREDTSMEKLSSLLPVFREGGSVTAGNACPINDGAAVALVLSMDKCREYGLMPVLKFIDGTAAGVDPNLLGIGPVPAVGRLLERNRLTSDDIDLVEFNEAFASQVLASLRELNIPEHKVNIGGGALAIGHPYGASGAILLTRLFHEMKKGQLGLATLGIGGGMGLAALFERIE